MKTKIERVPNPDIIMIHSWDDMLPQLLSIIEVEIYAEEA